MWRRKHSIRITERTPRRYISFTSNQSLTEICLIERKRKTNTDSEIQQPVKEIKFTKRKSKFCNYCVQHLQQTTHGRIKVSATKRSKFQHWLHQKGCLEHCSCFRWENWQIWLHPLTEKTSNQNAGMEYSLYDQ